MILSNTGISYTKIAKRTIQKQSIKRSRLDTLGIVSPKSVKPSKTGYDKYVKKQVAKAITMAQLFPLIDVKSKLKKSYWTTYHCNNVLQQIGHKIKATYCDQRWCTLCNRVRMAKMINAYSLPLLSLKDSHFVTLTAKNVKGDLLRDEVDRFLKVWRSMYKTIKKYHKHLRLAGMRKLECTYNPYTGFNPHFHFIIESKEVADLLVKLWLKHNKNRASIDGQDIRKADDKSIIELFKYTVKGVTKGKFHADALDVIYQSLYYRKTFYPIGIKKIVEENIDGIESEEITFKGDRDVIWKWSKEAKDWHTKDGELMTEYVLTGKLSDWIDGLDVLDRNEEITTK